MTIKQAAKKYGITSSALRYYESIGADGSAVDSEQFATMWFDKRI